MLFSPGRKSLDLFLCVQALICVQVLMLALCVSVYVRTIVDLLVRTCDLFDCIMMLILLYVNIDSCVSVCLCVRKSLTMCEQEVIFLCWQLSAYSC